MPPRPYGPGDQLRHDLKSPLTTIHARAQLLGRAVQRATSLTDEERIRILAGLAEIQTSVLEMVAVIDAMGDEPTKHADEVADELPQTGGDDPTARAGSARHAGLAFVTDPNPAFDVSHVGQTRARARYAAWHGRCVAR
jgi:hypothetical protein